MIVWILISTDETLRTTSVYCCPVDSIITISVHCAVLSRLVPSGPASSLACAILDRTCVIVYTSMSLSCLLLLLSRLLLLYCTLPRPRPSAHQLLIVTSRLSTMRTIYSSRPRLKPSPSSEAWRVGSPRGRCQRGRYYDGEELTVATITEYHPSLSLLSYLLSPVCSTGVLHHQLSVRLFCEHSDIDDACSYATLAGHAGRKIIAGQWGQRTTEQPPVLATRQ